MQRAQSGECVTHLKDQMGGCGSIEMRLFVVCIASSRDLGNSPRRAEGSSSLTKQNLKLCGILQLEKLSQQMQAAQRDLEAARNAEATARSKAAAEAKQRATYKAESDAAAANMRSEHAAELARLDANRKKLEVRTPAACSLVLLQILPVVYHLLTLPTSSMKVMSCQRLNSSLQLHKVVIIRLK